MSKARKQKAAARRPAIAESIDAELAGMAIAKRARNERPTRDELAALRRWEQRRDAQVREGCFEAIQKKLIVDLSGRSTKELHRLADKYSAPLRGATIDLAELLGWMFAFIDTHKATIDAANDKSRSTPELERLRAKTCEKLELDLAERRKELRHVDDVQRVLDYCASFIRRASRDLDKEFGPRAYAILQEAIADARKPMDKMVAEATRKGTDHEKV